MGIFDGYLQLKGKMTVSEYAGYICENTFSLLLYTCLAVLCFRNIWVILIKQRKWKQPLLLTFYFFCSIAIVFRWFVIFVSIQVSVTMLQGNNFVYIIAPVQPYAKLMLGLIQTWMIVDLFIRLRRYC